MRVLTDLRVKELEGDYRELITHFVFRDDVLGIIEIPAGFVCDYESVPFIKGSSKRAGVGHDYLYRIDSKPVVPKAVADIIYRELMKVCGVSQWRRTVKYLAVVLLGKSSYHKLYVDATHKQIMERKEMK